MDRKRVLVAFSSRSGSTAGAAEAIAAVLRADGFAVDCRPKEEVADVTPYRAVVLGSGVYVPSRASDGGGFLERHATALRGRDVWLYCSGPIGGRTVASDGLAGEVPVVMVGRAIGARGVGMFGSIGMPTGADPVAALLPASQQELRAWAAEIAAALGPAGPAAPRHAPRRAARRAPRRHRCHGLHAAG